MRILLLTQHYPPDSGATGRLVAELAHGLAARGHAPVVVAGAPSYPEARAGAAPADESTGGVRVLRVPTPRRREGAAGRGWHYLGFALAALLRCMRLPRPDVVLAFSSTPFFGGPAAAILSRWKGCPLVYCVQDVHPEMSVALGALREGRLARVLRGLESFAWRRATRVVVISDDLRAAAASRAVAGTQVATIRNWADPRRLAPRKASALRARLGLLPEDFVVQYAGNFGRAQDLETVLEAARLAGRVDGSVKLLLVGAGSGQGSIERRALRVPGAVVVPFQPDDAVADVLAAADLALVPLHRGLARWCVPSKVYSILASGRAVAAIVDDGSEVARVVAEGACGFRVDPGDAPGLARGILALAADRPRARRLGDNARAVLLRDGGLERAVLEYERVLQAACLEHGSALPDAGCRPGRVPPDTGYEHARVPPDTNCVPGRVPPDAGCVPGRVPPDAGCVPGRVPPDPGREHGSVPPDTGRKHEGVLHAAGGTETRSTPSRAVPGAPTKGKGLPGRRSGDG